MAMLSGRLVQKIEEHWEEIADGVITRIRRHPDLPTLAQQSVPELKKWCRDILENLGYWLSAVKGEERKRGYEILGRVRYEESIPVHEAVLRLQLLKDSIIDFVHAQGFTLTSMELYAEEELEHRVCRFFDVMIYHIVRGYETAIRVAIRAAS
jgi:hypothetical protein